MRLGVARHARVAARGAAARHYVAPVREMKFLLHEVHGFAPHYATLSARVTPCDAETLDAVVDASAALCEEVLAPLRAALAPDSRLHAVAVELSRARAAAGGAAFAAAPAADDDDDLYS